MTTQHPPAGATQEGASYPPPGYYPPQPPPKKKHTVRNVLLILIAVFILFVGGCMALIGGAANEIDKSIKESEKNNAPRAVEEGAQFTIGKYTVSKGWSIGKDDLGGYEAQKVVVENSSDVSDTVFFTMKVLKGSKVLGSIDCNTDEIEPGQQQDANCLSTSAGKFQSGWDKITVESTF
jgi:hypothetical protein